MGQEMQEQAEAMPLGSTMTPSQIRKLKIAIAIMSVMLVAGFILLLVGIYLQTEKLSQKSGAAQPVGTYVDQSGGTAGQIAVTPLSIPEGGKLTSTMVEKGLLILRIDHESGTDIAVVDLKTGQERRRIRLQSFGSQ